MESLIERLAKEDKAVLTREKIVFEDFVEFLREVETPKHYYNRFPWQSRIVVNNIIQFAIQEQKDLKVFLSDIWEFFGDKTVNFIKKLAENEQRIDVILARPPELNSFRKWRCLTDKFDNIRIRMFTHYDEKSSHFWLAGTAYRLEVPHPLHKGDFTELSPERPARFAFHNNEDAKRILVYWNQLSSNKDVQRQL